MQNCWGNYQPTWGDWIFKAPVARIFLIDHLFCSISLDVPKTKLIFQINFLSKNLYFYTIFFQAARKYSQSLKTGTKQLNSTAGNNIFFITFWQLNIKMEQGMNPRPKEFPKKIAMDFRINPFINSNWYVRCVFLLPCSFLANTLKMNGDDNSHTRARISFEQDKYTFL